MVVVSTVLIVVFGGGSDGDGGMCGCVEGVHLPYTLRGE